MYSYLTGQKELDTTYIGKWRLGDVEDLRESWSRPTHPFPPRQNLNARWMGVVARCAHPFVCMSNNMSRMKNSKQAANLFTRCGSRLAGRLWKMTRAFQFLLKLPLLMCLATQ